MLEKEKNIDAVMIATPDHMHADGRVGGHATGKHVYVEKPLTRTPWEARLLTQRQRNTKSPRRWAIRVIRTRVPGGMRDHLVGRDRRRERSSRLDRGVYSWPQEMTKVAATTHGSVPETLDWDLWLAAPPNAPSQPATRSILSTLSPRGTPAADEEEAQAASSRLDSICRSTGVASTTLEPG